MINLRKLRSLPQPFIIFLGVALGMAAYEFLKELFFKNTLSPWESHSITIIVTSLFATVASLIMRKWAISLEDELRVAAIAFETQEGMMVTDAHSVILRVNHAFTEITGYTAEEAVGQTPRLLKSDRHDEAFYAAMWESIQRTGAWKGEIWNRRKNGEVYPEHLTITAVKGGNGEIAHYITTMTDITERKRSEELVQQSEGMLRTIIGTIHDLIWLKNPDGIYLACNSMFERFFGAKETEIVGKTDYDFVDKELADFFREHDRKAMAKGGPSINEEGVTFADDGHRALLETVKTPMYDKSGQLIGVLGIARDITERKQAEQQLRIAAATFESQESILITDADSVILRVNQAFTETTGYTAEEAVGQTPRLLKSGRHDADFYRAMWEAIHRTGTWQGEIWDRRKNGEIYPKWLTISAVKGSDGIVTHYVGAHIDITERKAVEEAINKMAFYDTLTQLPNRRLLNDRLEQTIAASKRSGLYCALMFLDMDNFKPLNDKYGHGVGDLLLMEVARRITSCVREVDTVARFGGDEFVVILSELNADKTESLAQASFVAEKIRTALAELYVLKIQHEGKAETTIEHHCTPSIGVVLFINHQARTEEIIKWADMAMYQAKDAGRNLIRFYDSAR